MRSNWLQWGHALGAWKTLETLTGRHAKTELQWGHALGAWKTNSYMSTDQQHLRFNGAML